MINYASQRFFMVMIVAVACLGLVSTAQGALVAQWTFNEASGDALDISGNTGQDATLFGSPTRVTNGTQRYLELNGTTQYGRAEAGPTVALNIGTGNVTLTAWVRIDDGTSLSSEPAIGKWHSSTTTGRYALTFNGGTSSGNVFTYANSGGGSPFSAIPYDGNWHNVTLTYQSGVTGTDAFLYIDGGAAVASADIDSTLAGGNYLFWLGARPTSGGSVASAFFDGGIDEVRVYDTTMSQSEVQTLVNDGPVLIPEPASMALLVMGGLMMIRRR